MNGNLLRQLILYSLVLTGGVATQSCYYLNGPFTTFTKQNSANPHLRESGPHDLRYMALPAVHPRGFITQKLRAF
jgi:hypothetical protein